MRCVFVIASARRRGDSRKVSRSGLVDSAQNVTVAAGRWFVAEAVLDSNYLDVLGAQRVDDDVKFVHRLADDRASQNVAESARVATVIEHDLLSGTR